MPCSAVPGTLVQKANFELPERFPYLVLPHEKSEDQFLVDNILENTSSYK